jgi:hypothetical protein
MNVAIGIGTLLLGAWVLNEPVTEKQPGVAAQSRAPTADTRAQGTAKSKDPTRALPREEVEQRKRNPALLTDGQSPRQKSGQANGQPETQRRDEGVIPAAPTESGYGTGLGMPSAPTARQDGSEVTPYSTAPEQSYGPMAPTRPNIPPSRKVQNAVSQSYYGVAEMQRTRAESGAYSGYAAQQPPTKALASARPFSSGVSPYMGLFRNDTAGGTIDNYSTMVRPALDQRSMNQQFNMDIYGLERNARLQNAAMRQLDRSNRTPQNISTPQYFRTYGDSYPGYNSQ